MASFNIYEAKARLSKLIRLVRAGQEVVIADAGTPVAKLIPIELPKLPRELGGDRGKIWVSRDAFDPLPGDELAVWDAALFPSPHQPQPQPVRPRRTGKPQRSNPGRGKRRRGKQ